MSVFINGVDSIELYLRFYKDNAVKASTNLATPPTLTTGEGAWEKGSTVDLIPINTVTKQFEVERINIGTVSKQDTYQVYLYANDVEFYTQRFIKDVGFGVFFWIPVFSRIFPPNTKINAKLAKLACSGGASATCTVSLAYREKD